MRPSSGQGGRTLARKLSQPTSQSNRTASPLSHCVSRCPALRSLGRAQGPKRGRFAAWQPRSMAGPARYTVSVYFCNPRPRTFPVFQLLLGVCHNCPPASRAILCCLASWISPPLIRSSEKSKTQPAQSGLPTAPNRVLSISEGCHVHRHPSMVGRRRWFRCDGEDQAPRGRSPRATRLGPVVARTWFRLAPGTNRYWPSVGHYTSQSAGSHPAPDRGIAEDGFHWF